MRCPTPEPCADPAAAAPDETPWAAFDANGRLVAAGPAAPGAPGPWAAAPAGAAADAILADFLAGFADLPAKAGAGPDRIARAVEAWCRPGAALAARDGLGRARLLTSVPRPEGGRVCLAPALPERPASAEEALLGDLVDAMADAFALYDGDWGFVMGNRKLREMVYRGFAPPVPGERSADTMLRLARAGFYALPDGADIEAAVAAMAQDVRDCAKEVAIELADGRVLLRSTHATRLGGYLVTFTDATARRRAERAEREADMLVRKIVDAAPTTLLVSRVSDGRILYYPPASRDRYGEAETTAGFFLTPGDRQRLLDALLPTGRLDDFPMRYRRSDGSVMFGMTSARLTDWRGEDVIVSSTRDVTEQLRMQAELERSREAAHQNEKLSALGELLAGVAHELNNPLSIVVGYAQMLEGRSDDPVLARRIERIAQAADRCARIVRTFLAMARQRPARIEPCAMNALVETALDIAGYGLRAAGVEVVLALAPELPPVAADPDQIAQVFTNLLLNAEHALRERGAGARLTLRTRHDPERGAVVAEVADNGPGVPEAIRARVFEPFFTTKEVGTGTGVGLAFGHRIVHAHGGRLTVHAEPGGGACFRVRLKVAAGPAS